MTDLIERLKGPPPVSVTGVLRERAEAASTIQSLSERIAEQGDLLSTGSVCMTPQERVRWIDRVRAHLEKLERASLIKEGSRNG